jgi:predicted DNA-binding transcriptional regulator YafY
MARTHRLFDLLQHLRHHRQPVSGSKLAHEVGISVRTLYRDIATLQSLGADIQGEAGVGYVLRPGFMLPPLMFTEEEIEAIALGAQWVGKRTDTDLASAARNAMSKIAAVLPEQTRMRLEHLSLVVSRGSAATGPDLKLLRKAVREERVLLITYRDAEGKQTNRRIWPFAIGFLETSRAIGAWCELRKDYRHFRFDRIEKFEILAERYPRRRQVLLKEWKEMMLTKSVTK